MATTVEADYYEILGIKATDAGADEVRAAWKRAVKATHPDAGGTDALFRLVQEAGTTLLDPEKRAAYDQERARPREQPTWPPAGPPPAAPEPADEWVTVDEEPPPTPADEWVAVDEHQSRRVRAPVRGLHRIQSWYRSHPQTVSDATKAWPWWQRWLSDIGFLFTFPFAVERALEIAPPTNDLRILQLVIVMPALLLLFPAVLFLACRFAPRRRWIWCVWALEGSTTAGIILTGLVVLWALTWAVLRARRRHLARAR